ncbi:MAG: hypothetical protein ABL984_21170 [Pyrinomonadaceae bacterium]
MLDANLIATLEKSLQETRNAQVRLMARLREVEHESDRLREEIQALENSAAQTESAVDGLLVAMRSGSRSLGTLKSLSIESDTESMPTVRAKVQAPEASAANHDHSMPLPFHPRKSGTVAYLSQRRVPHKENNISAISNRFSDRTITQACTLLLREAGEPLHVNELYNLLVSGGMEFKGNNPTISVAVSLNRNRRFRKVGPGTFDLMMRDASRAAS